MSTPHPTAYRRPAAALRLRSAGLLEAPEGVLDGLAQDASLAAQRNVQRHAQEARFWNDATGAGQRQRRAFCTQLFEQQRAKQKKQSAKTPLMVLCIRALQDQNIHLARHKNKGVSQITKARRAEGGELILNDLKAVGFDLFGSTPLDMKHRHIVRLVNAWVDTSEGLPCQYPVRKLSVKTIVNAFTLLRGWMCAMGRNDEVSPITQYVEDPRRVRFSGVATEDGSWEAAGIDVPKVIEAWTRKSERMATALELGWRYGLRISEALAFNPAEDIIEHGTSVGLENDGVAIAVWRAAKGGRHRAFVPLTAHQQKAALVLRDRWRAQYGHLAPKLQRVVGERSMKAAKNWISRQTCILSEAHGKRVVFHGLRKGSLLNDAQTLGVRTTIRPEVKGRPLPERLIPDANLLMVEKMGHSDPTKAQSYYGQVLRPDGTLAQRKSPAVINGAMRRRGREMVRTGTSVAEMAKALGIGLRAAYNLFEDGELKLLRALNAQAAAAKR